MTRNSSELTSLGSLPASAPSEALLFARAITGDPSRGGATDDAGAGIDGEYLEWLAAISPEHERRLRNLAETPQGDEPRREQLEWLAAISPEYARQLRDLEREEAFAAEVRDRSQRIIERLEHAAEVWDDSKHPRAGGPPNAGWFVSTGGSTALAPMPANPSPKPDALAHSPRQQDQLAQAQQPAQPPAQGTKPAPAPGGGRHPDKFGTWRKRAPNYVPQIPRNNGMGVFHAWQVKNAYEALPQPVKDVLKKNRVELALDADDGGVRTEHPEMKADASGAYDSGKGIIHMFDRTLLPGNIKPPTRDLAHAFRHEIGHAMDHYLGDMSQTPGFARAYQADKNAVPKDAVKMRQNEHHLSTPSEAFAEAFARALEGGEHPGVLPNSVRYLQQSPAIRQLFGK